MQDTVQETDPIRELIQAAVDSLPDGDPDRLWLAYVLDNSDATALSVKVLAANQARNILGIGSGPFALEAGADTTATKELVSATQFTGTAADFAEPEPDEHQTIQGEVNNPAPAPPLGGIETTPVPDEADEPVDASEDGDSLTPEAPVVDGPISGPEVEDLATAVPSADEPEQPTVPGTVFGAVPVEVDDAVYASDENGKVALDLVVVNDEAEELAAIEIGKAAEAAEALAVEEFLAGAVEYIATPLPPIPDMPGLVAAEYIGSEPVIS